ncbi:MAG: ABC transporter substrate-binding protein [Caldilineaceae bacterium]
MNQPNSRFHTKFLTAGATWIMPKHIFEGVEDPVTFESFNPFVGTGPYKLYSYDPSGFWTIWEKRDWDKTPTGMMYGEPQPTYIVFQNWLTRVPRFWLQLTHEADVLNLSTDGMKAVLEQCDTCRGYQPDWPYVVNNDPAITGITFNTARAPYDNKDVRWAMLLAIDISDYSGIAVDGTGVLPAPHIPSLSNYPKDFIDPMLPWLEELPLDIGNGETQPFDVNAAQRRLSMPRAVIRCF